MTKKNTTSNFLIQGSILAFAGILVRIIGMIYRIPLNNILGTEGMGYYSAAYGVYNIVLILSSQSMPLAVSKVISERITKGEYKNAYKAFKYALLYSTVIGLFFGIITFVGADILADLYGYPPASRALKVLAPTIVIVSVIGVFRGYFQGLGQIGPTALSQIFEQIVNAIVSVIAGYQLYSFGKSMTALSKADSLTNASSYSAAGGTLGTCLGALAAFIVLLFIFVKTRPEIKNNIEADNNTTELSNKSIFKILIYTITPVIISTAIYNVGDFLDGAIYGNITKIFFDIPKEQRSSLFGVYNGQYQLLTTVPIAIASAMSLSIVPTIVKSFSEKNMVMVKNKIDMSLKFTMIIAFPCGVGLSVLGGPICNLLFKANEFSSVLSQLMCLSIFPVVSFSLSTITSSILQGINKMKTPMINSGISLLVHFILLPVLLLIFKLDIYGVAIGNFTFSIIVFVLNAIAIYKELGYKQEIKNTFVKPLASAGIMGIVAYGIYLIFNNLMKFSGAGFKLANGTSVIIAIIFAVITYFVVLIKIKGINEEVLLSFPKGTLIVNVCKKMHLL